MADIFLSYATANRQFVDQIREALEEKNYSTWMDHQQIQAGGDWGEEIESGVRRCKIFIVAVTEDSQKSKWVKRECLLAEDLGKPRIPILRSGTKLPFGLMDLQYIDFRENQQQFKFGIKLLLEVLKQH